MRRNRNLDSTLTSMPFRTTEQSFSNSLRVKPRVWVLHRKRLRVQKRVWYAVSLHRKHIWSGTELVFARSSTNGCWKPRSKSRWRCQLQHLVLIGFRRMVSHPNDPTSSLSCYLQSISSRIHTSDYSGIDFNSRDWAYSRQRPCWSPSAAGLTTLEQEEFLESSC